MKKQGSRDKVESNDIIKLMVRNLQEVL